MLEIKNLTKYYGNIKGVEDINLSIEKGEIFGFIGPNGAGKSTTIKCIMNLIKKDKGNIYIDGEEVTFNNDNIREMIGYLPGEVHLYEDLTVQEMIDYSASFYKKNCKKKAKELVEKLNLDTSKKVEQLSLGNLKKLGIVLALIHSPKLVILDEATSGLDPLMQEEFYSILLEEKKKGTTIFFSSHILSEIKKICDKVAIIKDGKIIKIENMKEMEANEFLTVTIYTSEVKSLIKMIDAKIIDKNDNYFKFMYNGDINKIIKILSGKKIDKLIIEEPSTEEVFMHYYKED